VSDTDGAVSEGASVVITVNPPTVPTPTATLSLDVDGDFPTAVVAGGKGKLTLVATLRNLTSSPFAGPVSIDLATTTDPTLGDVVDALAAPFTSFTRNLKLAPGASRTVPIKLKAYPAVPDGKYLFLGRAFAPSIEPSNVAATIDRMTIAAPFKDLSVLFAEPPRTGAFAGSRTVLRVDVFNESNTTVAGDLPVKIGANGPGAFQTLTEFTTRVKLKPNAHKILKIRVIWPTRLGDYSIFTEITPIALGDTNNFNDNSSGGTISVF
jgi:hypothetical protein